MADRFPQPAVIEPVHLFQGGKFDGIEMTPRSPVANDLRFVEQEHSQSDTLPFQRWSGVNILPTQSATAFFNKLMVAELLLV